MKLEIHKRVAYEDLHWGCVHERLGHRTKASGLAVDELVKQFTAYFFGNLKAHWVRPAELAQGENLVAAAICECHGCDEITIERKFKISLGLGGIPVFQALRFRARGESTGRVGDSGKVSAHLVSGLVRIGPGRIAVDVRSYKRLFLFSAGFIVIVSMFYALAALLIVHGLAVFSTFLSDPGGITIMATQRAEVGIALIGVLVGLTAFLRGVVRSIYRWVRRQR